VMELRILLNVVKSVWMSRETVLNNDVIIMSVSLIFFVIRNKLPLRFYFTSYVSLTKLIQQVSSRDVFDQNVVCISHFTHTSYVPSHVILLITSPY
jgi:hypothetical protein